MSTHKISAKRQRYLREKQANSQKRDSKAQIGQSTNFNSDNLQEWDANENNHMDNRKPLQRKDSSLFGVQEKLKRTEEEAQRYKSEVAGLEFNLNFYKQKLQEQCQESAVIEEEIDHIIQALKKCAIKFSKLLENGEQMTTTSQTMSESIHYSQNQLDTLWTLLKKIAFGIEFIEGSACINGKKQIEDYKLIIESQKSQLKALQEEYDSQRRNFSISNRELSQKIKQLTELYESKSIEADERKRQISKMMEQRQFNRQLLMSSEKERMGLFNDIYKIGKSKYKINLQDMSKGEVGKICIMLYSKIDDLEVVKVDLEEKLLKMETESMIKYESLLKVVREYQRGNQVKPKLKRMESMTVM